MRSVCHHLPVSNQNFNNSTNFIKSHQHKILWKSVQPVSSFYLAYTNCVLTHCLPSSRTHNVMKSYILRDITPCIPLKINRRFAVTNRLSLQHRIISQARNWVSLLATCCILISCLAYSSTMKMEATCLSETSLDFQRTTRSYIPEDRTLHNHRCDNLTSYTHCTV
jgi:hypothetical protein